MMFRHKNILLIIICLTFISAVVFSAETKTKIAVYELSTKEVSEDMGQILTSIIRDTISNIHVFDLISKRDMQQILDHISGNEKVKTDCSSDTCLALIARVLGVDTIIAGSVAKSEDGYLIYLQQIEAVSANSLNAVYLECPNSESLLIEKIKLGVLTLLKIQDQELEADISNEDIRVNVLKSISYADKHMYDKAIFNINTVFEYKNDCDNLYFYRGKFYNEQGQYDQALHDFNKALEINPECARAYKYRGDIFFYNKHEYEQAIVDYSKAIAINIRYVEAYISRANAYYYNSKQYDKAISDLNKVIELNPKCAEAYYNKAIVCEEVSQLAEATEAYNSYLQYASSQEEPLVNQVKEKVVNSQTK